MILSIITGCIGLFLLIYTIYDTERSIKLIAKSYGEELEERKQNIQGMTDEN